MSTRILTLSPDRYHALHGSGQGATLIDVRTPAEYRAGHAAGALLLPLDELGPGKLEELTGQPDLGRERPLYLTCATGRRALQAAERLMEAGLRNIAVIDGGTQAWERAGLPMRRCGVAVSLERQVQIAVGALLLLKVVFGFTVHELFFAAVGLVGAGLIVSATRWCGIAKLLARMPWNRGRCCPDEVSA